MIYEWQPIETAPKDGTEVYIGFYYANMWIVRNAVFVSGDTWVESGGKGEGGWMYDSIAWQERLEGEYEPQFWAPAIPRPGWLQQR